MIKMTEEDKTTLESLKKIEKIFAKSLSEEDKKKPKLGGHVSLYLLENTQTGDNPITIYRPNIEGGIDTEMLIFAREYLSSVIESIQKDGLPEYNPDWGEGTFKIDSGEVKASQRIYKCIASQRGCAAYVKDKVKEDKLKAWILRFGVTVDGHYTQIYLFQRFQPAKMLGSKKKFSMFVKGETFYLAPDNIYSLSQEMDFLLLKDTFIITNTFSFEKVFSYEVFYKAKAGKFVDDLVAQAIPGLKYIDIDSKSAEDIKDKINKNTPLARRISSAEKNMYCKDINYAKLVDLKQRHKLNITLRRRRLIIDDESDLQDVARVLNDDYEISQLTPNEYLAFAKRDITPKGTPKSSLGKVKKKAPKGEERAKKGENKVPVGG
jgi:hypothetical protein